MLVLITAICLVALLGLGCIAVLHRRRQDPAITAARECVKQARKELEGAQHAHRSQIKAASSQLAAAEKQQIRAQKQATKALELERGAGRVVGRYKGVVLCEREIRTPHGSGSLIGAHASVDSQVSSRITATRLATIGVFALAAKKKTGHLYLSIDSPGVASVVECPPEDQRRAREFAVKIMNQARAAAADAPHRPQKIQLAAAALEAASDRSEVGRLRDDLAGIESDPATLRVIAEAEAALTSATDHLTALKTQPRHRELTA